ncbi:MAG: ABC transporter ATP-binding protein, partial [Phycisphaerales bacterium]|nr:ABC transporter ATP-binding protein [Phycisphaerales bacterium]
MTAITLKGLGKQFGATVAVRNVDLLIESGELFFLLGPSGCGKTTLLRMIAGFIEPSSGSIHFGDRDVTNVPPNRRNSGMVFQSYALWPHMTVGDNVAYGLRVRKVAADELARRVDETLRLVHMVEYSARKPNQLSGGQQQRVALARALVIEPTVLLLDEPLSNLDAKLRLEMRTEIRRICKQTGITTVYVTHDQKEALSMADRVAVMRNGAIEQIGPPHLLYQRPISRFVADFLGETNFLTAVVGATNGNAIELETGAGALRATGWLSKEQPAPGSRVTCSIRPEAMKMTSQSTGNSLAGQLMSSVYFGETVQHQIRLKDGTLVRAIELNPRAGQT